MYFLDRHDPVLADWLIVSLAVASGALLLVGYLTRLAGILAALSCMTRMPVLVSSHTGSVFDSLLPIALESTIAIALAFLGPGACSLDARMFGPREIIIPRSPLPPD